MVIVMDTTKLPHGIQRRGASSYRLMVSHGYFNGKQQRYYRTIDLPGSMTERAQIKEAERQRALFLAEIERGDVTLSHQMSVAQFAKDWMDLDVKMKGLSAVTINDYQRTLDTRIIPYLGGEKLHKLSPLTISRFLNELLQLPSARGGRIATRSVLHVFGVLRTMLNMAVRWGFMAKNPALLVNPPRSDTKEAAIYDEEQCRTLLKALEGAPIQYRAAVALALFSQIRKGELAGLDWKQVDLSDGTISICQSAVYVAGQGVIIKQPKTRAGVRKIVVPKYVVNLLKSLKRSQAEDRMRLGELWQQSGAVFLAWNGLRIHPDTVPNWFADFLKTNHLPKIRFHALRHTGASLLIAEGEDVTTVSRRLGHADAHTTLKIYAHAFVKKDVGASARLESALLKK